MLDIHCWWTVVAVVNMQELPITWLKLTIKNIYCCKVSGVSTFISITSSSLPVSHEELCVVDFPPSSLSSSHPSQQAYTYQVTLLVLSGHWGSSYCISCYFMKCHLMKANPFLKYRTHLLNSAAGLVPYFWPLPVYQPSTKTLNKIAGTVSITRPRKRKPFFMD